MMMTFQRSVQLDLGVHDYSRSCWHTFRSGISIAHNKAGDVMDIIGRLSDLAVSETFAVP